MYVNSSYSIKWFIYKSTEVLVLFCFFFCFCLFEFLYTFADFLYSMKTYNIRKTAVYFATYNFYSLYCVWLYSMLSICYAQTSTQQLKRQKVLLMVVSKISKYKSCRRDKSYYKSCRTDTFLIINHVGWIHSYHKPLCFKIRLVLDKNCC